MRTAMWSGWARCWHTRGKKQEETTVISAGDIGAITKLPEAVTGDTLCDPAYKVKFAETGIPEAHPVHGCGSQE